MMEPRETPATPAPAAQHLQSDQIALIEGALASVGEYGEVRLVVEKGRLRFLVLQKSLDVLKEGAGRVLQFKNDARAR
jgi:hypothetical protein